MIIEVLREHRCFGGLQLVCRHASTVTGTPMEFSIYLPSPTDYTPRPLLTWLSGLTCTWVNFTEKAGAQRYAAEHGLILACPDTSPRGLNLPGEHESYDFGSGAGFYVDATVEPWSQHYRMYSYITEELPALLVEAFPVDLKTQGIFGHSMGGHGALTIAFSKPGRYRSLSAFAPIVAPSEVPWGKKAFEGYLGSDHLAWRAHDACALAATSGWTSPILIDQGTNDEFLATQLIPERFAQACSDANIPLTLRRQEGYDHSYYFISSFIGDHIEHHAKLLKSA